MSHAALEWSFRQTGVPTALRYVLTCIGFHANPDTNRSWPSAGTIAMETGLAVRSVERLLPLAEKLGLIVAAERTPGHAVRWLPQLHVVITRAVDAPKSKRAAKAAARARGEAGPPIQSRRVVNLRQTVGVTPIQSRTPPTLSRTASDSESDRTANEPQRNPKGTGVPPAAPPVIEPHLPGLVVAVAVKPALEPKLKGLALAKLLEVQPGEDPAFPAWWARYPNKRGGRDAGSAAYHRAKNKPGVTDAVLAAGLEATPFQSRAKYQPHAQTWLNQGRWSNATETDAIPMVGRERINKYTGQPRMAS